MKTFKILTIGLACALALASCNKVVTPSGDATVGFAAAEYETGLGSEYIYVPIVTTGETTVYPIKVTVEVGEYTGDFAAVEDVDYMITAKEIYVASAESSPSVEIKILNPKDADALNFVLKITSQDNAQSISQAEVLVKCEKSELDRICGRWNVVGQSNGSAYSEVWTLSNDGGRVAISGICGESGTIVGDLNTENMTVSFLLGPGTENMVAAYNFSGIGPHYVGPTLGTYVSGGVAFIKEQHFYVGSISEDFKTITWQIEEGYGLGLMLYTYDETISATNNFYAYPVIIDNNTITKQ